MEEEVEDMSYITQETGVRKRIFRTAMSAVLAGTMCVPAFSFDRNDLESVDQAEAASSTVKFEINRSKDLIRYGSYITYVGSDTSDNNKDIICISPKDKAGDNGTYTKNCSRRGTSFPVPPPFVPLQPSRYRRVS